MWELPLVSVEPAVRHPKASGDFLNGQIRPFSEGSVGAGEDASVWTILAQRSAFRRSSSPTSVGQAAY